jgi:hypothetical protein
MNIFQRLWAAISPEKKQEIKKKVADAAVKVVKKKVAKRKDKKGPIK